MGLYKVDDMYLYLNRGTGLWGGLPVRIGVEAEITEITLRTTKKTEPETEATH